jgi:hypothetical protein
MTLRFYGVKSTVIKPPSLAVSPEAETAGSPDF